MRHGRWKVIVPWPKVVLVLGFASFFTDLASELIYPLLPLFLSQVLAASPVHIGLIEGVAEATASLMKVVSGIWTDRLQARKPLIVLGYSVSGLVRPLIAMASNWYFVLFVRFTDRVGKGLRTAPRDTLLAEATSPTVRGRAFGFHRAMDHAGAVAGPLLAAGLMGPLHLPLRTVFALALFPGLLTILVLIFGVKENRKTGTTASKIQWNWCHLMSHWRELEGDYKKFLLAILIFTLGKSADSFLLLRLGDFGMSAAEISVLWALHNLIKMASSFWGGKFSDQIGHTKNIALAWVFYAMTYLVMGFSNDANWVVGAFLFYGIYFGFTEPSEKALVAQLVSPSHRGVAYGYYHFVIGLTVLPSSIGFGLLWKFWGAPYAFVLGACLAFLATSILPGRKL